MGFLVPNGNYENFMKRSPNGKKLEPHCSRLDELASFWLRGEAVNRRWRGEQFTHVSVKAIIQALLGLFRFFCSVTVKIGKRKDTICLILTPIIPSNKSSPILVPMSPLPEIVKYNNIDNMTAKTRSKNQNITQLIRSFCFIINTLRSSVTDSID